MKEPLTLSKKYVHFSYDNHFYHQNDGVAAEFPIELVLAGIFMAELETQIVSKLRYMVLNWKRFIDDTIGYLKNSSIWYYIIKA